jgi:hypothetical protein
VRRVWRVRRFTRARSACDAPSLISAVVTTACAVSPASVGVWCTREWNRVDLLLIALLVEERDAGRWRQDKRYDDGARHDATTVSTHRVSIMIMR